MFEQIFKNIDDVLWKETGCSSELDYTEQTSWMLFLKYLDDLEGERAIEAELKGQSYEFIIDAEHHWSRWAAPKTSEGAFDHDNALTGDDLKEFVELQTTFAESEKSWTINAGDIDQETFDLSVKNPNTPEEAPLRNPQEILANIAKLDAEAAQVLDHIRGMV